MDFVRIIFRDLRRNLRRTTMTITSIAVSLFVFCALMSFAKLPDQMRANADSSVRLVCRNKAGLGHGLPQAYTSKIQGAPAHHRYIGMEFLRLPRPAARRTPSHTHVAGP